MDNYFVYTQSGNAESFFPEIYKEIHPLAVEAAHEFVKKGLSLTAEVISTIVNNIIKKSGMWDEDGEVNASPVPSPQGVASASSYNALGVSSASSPAPLGVAAIPFPVNFDAPASSHNLSGITPAPLSAPLNVSPLSSGVAAESYYYPRRRHYHHSRNSLRDLARILFLREIL